MCHALTLYSNFGHLQALQPVELGRRRQLDHRRRSRWLLGEELSTQQSERQQRWPDTRQNSFFLKTSSSAQCADSTCFFVVTALPWIPSHLALRAKPSNPPPSSPYNKSIA